MIILLKVGDNKRTTFATNTISFIKIHVLTIEQNLYFNLIKFLSFWFGTPSTSLLFFPSGLNLRPNMWILISWVD